MDQIICSRVLAVDNHVLAPCSCYGSSSSELWPWRCVCFLTAITPTWHQHNDASHKSPCWPQAMIPNDSLCRLQLSSPIHLPFFLLRVLLVYFLYFHSGGATAVTRRSTPTHHVLRGKEGDVGERPGRLHGNGLIWEYPEKTWFFSQIEERCGTSKKSSCSFNKPTPQVCYQNAVNSLSPVSQLEFGWAGPSPALPRPRQNSVRFKMVNAAK